MTKQAATPSRVARGARGGWQPEEVSQLFEEIHASCEQGEPLRSVFERMAERLGRKPNSIRNFYYAQLKQGQEPELKRAPPFEPFSQGEVRELLRAVLAARAEGKSVRACVQEMADGDKSKMLRYQNKYRSCLKTRPSLVREVMADMEAAGEPYVDPFQPRAHQESPQALLEEAQGRVESMQDPALYQMLEGLNHLLALAQNAPTQETAIALDRLNVRYDLLRIALDDERTRAHRLDESLSELVLSIKEFLGLPEFTRAQRVGEFCQRLSEQLAPLEAQLPFVSEEE